MVTCAALLLSPLSLAGPVYAATSPFLSVSPTIGPVGTPQAGAGSARSARSCPERCGCGWSGNTARSPISPARPASQCRAVGRRVEACPGFSSRRRGCAGNPLPGLETPADGGRVACGIRRVHSTHASTAERKPHDSQVVAAALAVIVENLHQALLPPRGADDLAGGTLVLENAGLHVPRDRIVRKGASCFRCDFRIYYASVVKLWVLAAPPTRRCRGGFPARHR